MVDSIEIYNNSVSRPVITMIGLYSRLLCPKNQYWNNNNFNFKKQYTEKQNNKQTVNGKQNRKRNMYTISKNKPDEIFFC